MKTYEQLVSEMGKSETRELENRLAVVIEHLLKIKHIKGQIYIDNIRGWEKSVKDQRSEIVDHIDEIPG